MWISTVGCKLGLGNLLEIGQTRVSQSWDSRVRGCERSREDSGIVWKKMEPDDMGWQSDRVRVKYFIITVINLIIIIVIANRIDLIRISCCIIDLQITVFDSSFDGFEASSDDDDNVDEWNNLFFKSRPTIFCNSFKYIFFQYIV